MNINIIMSASQIAVTRYPRHDKEQNSVTEQSSYAFLLLAIAAKEDGIKEIVRTKLLAHLRELIAGGNEPCCDAVQIWSYPAVACAITVCKQIPKVWEMLSEDEIEKLDTIMFALAAMNNFISNDQNEYKTGVGLLGDVYKDRVPNFRFPFTIPIIAASYYFGGADALDEMFLDFDYDAFIEKLTRFNFVNMLKRWTTPSFTRGTRTYPGAKELLTQESNAFVVSNAYGDFGNIYTAGYGKGIKIPYIYKGFRADGPDIVENLVEYNHSGGVCVSHTPDLGGGVYECYTVDGSTSEAEGLEGMLIEYNAKDAGGIRSGGHYCSVDFSMQVALLSMLKALGAYDIKSTALWEKVSAGATDHLNKMRAGYVGKGMGIKHFENANNLRGHSFARYLYSEYIAK